MDYLVWAALGVIVYAGVEQENLRLKRIMANQALDLSIFKEVASGNF